jgi:hypothetical protein
MIVCDVFVCVLGDGFWVWVMLSNEFFNLHSGVLIIRIFLLC